MNCKILKWKIEPISVFKMPKGAQVISVGVQNRDEVVIWARCDSDHTETEERQFHAYPTGRQFEFNPLKHIFIGTVQMQLPETLVFYIFEVLP